MSGTRADDIRRRAVSSASFVVGAVVDADYWMLGTPDEPDVEVRVTEVARLVAAYGQRFVRPPIEVLKALPVHIVEGSEPLEGWVDIPLWTEREAPSDLVIRMRLVSQGWSVHSELVGIRLEAPTVRGTPPPPVPRVVPDVPAPVEPLGPGEYPGDFGPVPEKWRPLIAAVVHRLVEKDYVGLAADGTYTGDPALRVEPGTWGVRVHR